MRIVGLILAKGDSKRLPLKNLKLLAGKPMFLWNVEKCLRVFDEVYVSSESSRIRGLAKEIGAKVIVRPKRLCGNIPNIPVYKHAMRSSGFPDAIVAVQACSPTISVGLIERARDLMFGGCRELMTCYPIHWMQNYHDQGFPIYGSIWALNKERMVLYEDYFRPTPEVLLVDDSIDIHTQEDFDKVEGEILRTRNGN